MSTTVFLVSERNGEVVAVFSTRELAQSYADGTDGECYVEETPLDPPHPPVLGRVQHVYVVALNHDGSLRHCRIEEDYNEGTHLNSITLGYIITPERVFGDTGVTDGCMTAEVIADTLELAVKFVQTLREHLVAKGKYISESRWDCGRFPVV